MCNYVRRLSVQKFQNKYGVMVTEIEGYPLKEKEWDSPEKETGFDRPGMPVMVSANPERWVWMEWGLIPRNIDSMPNSRAMEVPILNAKAETIFELPSFYDSARHRRCIIPIEGFYEWQHGEEDVTDKRGKQRKKKVKQAYYIEHEDGIVYVAGIWDEYKGQKTFAKITTEANPLMKVIHNTKMRQPHQLLMKDWEAWFAAKTEAEVKTLLSVFPDDNMKASEYNPAELPPPPPTDTDGTPTLF